VFSDIDPARDRVVMAEVEAEIRRHPNHKQRVAMFLAAMRHFRDDLRERGLAVDYQEIGDRNASEDLASFLAAAIDRHRPQRVVVTEPGRHDLIGEFQRVCDGASVEFDMRADSHFLASHGDFDAWAKGRKQLRLEYFYRTMRKRYDVLMDGDDPVGGAWNFDSDNRESFDKDGPGNDIKGPIRFRPDDTTRRVLELVSDRFSDLPGSLDRFDWPVTRDEAQRAVRDFIAHRLPRFGAYQDAMWTGRPFLYHSRVSTALNLKLVSPRYVIDHAEAAYRDGSAPINAVEGFIRQVLGWREFIRGIYWHHMPDYASGNELGAQRDLPDLFWTGETNMACLRDVVGQLLDTAYAHHIQRLMVAGLFGQLYGVAPDQMHDWFMALYADSVEWVTLPNVVGMSQHADGGIVGSKPYIATGSYINRMSNYCGSCEYNPKKATGDRACPFTTLYWDFLLEHEDRFRGHQRMSLQVRNLDRKSADDKQAIRDRATYIRRRIREGNA